MPQIFTIARVRIEPLPRRAALVGFWRGPFWVQVAYGMFHRNGVPSRLRTGGTRIQAKIGGGVNATGNIFVLVHYLVAVTHFARKSRLVLGDAIEAEKPARPTENERNT